MPLPRGRLGRKHMPSKTMRKVARQEALKVVKRQSETKRTAYGQENIQLYHNVPHFHNNMLYTTNGTESGDREGIVATRIGDELFLKSLRLRLWMSNKTDRPNCIYRIILYWYETSNPPAAQADLFNETGPGLLTSVNRENISVIADKYVRNVRDANTTDIKEHSTLKFVNKNWKNRKVVYNDTEGSSALPKDKSLGFAVLCYDAYGTLTTDNIASFAYQYDVLFKEN